MPLRGVSVFCALDEPLPELLVGRLPTYLLIRASTVGRLRVVGFGLLPTFARPHSTIVLASA